MRELRAAGLGLDLDPDRDEPSRCGRCNGRLERYEADGTDRPDYVPDGESAVWRCVDCGRLFWRGSHWDRVAGTLSEL